jgi:hypothetical protein
MISGEHIERAEKVMKVRGEAGGMIAVYESAQVDPAAMADFVKFCVEQRLPQTVPDLDPRAQPSINTLLAHAFLVGVHCGRGEAIHGE